MADDTTDRLYTTQGVLPVTALRRVDRWHVDEREAAHRVEYFLGDELVRADVSVYVREGQAVLPQQATLGG